MSVSLAGNPVSRKQDWGHCRTRKSLQKMMSAMSTILFLLPPQIEDIR